MDMFRSFIHDSKRYRDAIGVMRTETGLEKLKISCIWKWNVYKKRYKAYYYVKCGSKHLNYADFYKDHKEQIILGRKEIRRALNWIGGNKKEKSYLRKTSLKLLEKWR
jgi:hypothetical protein